MRQLLSLGQLSKELCVICRSLMKQICGINVLDHKYLNHLQDYWGRSRFKNTFIEECFRKFMCKMSYWKTSKSITQVFGGNVLQVVFLNSYIWIHYKKQCFAGRTYASAKFTKHIRCVYPNAKCHVGKSVDNVASWQAKAFARWGLRRPAIDVGEALSGVIKVWVIGMHVRHVLCIRKTFYILLFNFFSLLKSDSI